MSGKRGNKPSWHDRVERWQGNWNLLAGFGAWICGIVGVFWVVPPFEDASPTPTMLRAFAAFFTAVFAGLMIVASVRYSRRKDRDLWIVACSIALLVGLSYFIYYNLLINRYICRGVVVSDRLTEFGENRRDYLEKARGVSTITKCDLVEALPRHYRSVFDAEARHFNRLLIAASYVVGLPLFSVCIISVVQAMYCSGIGKPSRRS